MYNFVHFYFQKNVLFYIDINTYCDVFNAFEKKHRDNTYEYLKNNNLTIF